jgi:hypothetical protein
MPISHRHNFKLITYASTAKKKTEKFGKSESLSFCFEKNQIECLFEMRPSRRTASRLCCLRNLQGPRSRQNKGEEKEN